ncbi:MAG TPA: winged helix-turn-helix domain-containing protein [Acidobacteriota bacterium]|jgi:TolB-like protein/DNA-binding winged helix-turn-helix (wHTH) protein
MQSAAYDSYRFDDFTLDPASGCLLRHGQEVKLRPKVFDALKYLVENNNRLISKDELIKAVWSDSFVTDDSLVQCIVELRRALGDESQQIIKTVPRRGYIFKAETRKVDAPAAGTIYVEQVEGVRVIIEETETENKHLLVSALDSKESSRSTQTFAETAPKAPTANETLAAAVTQSTARRLIAKIKRHNRVVAVILAVALAGAATVYFYFAAAGRAIRSVAVLPFVSAGSDPNTEYLSDGITESIIYSISRLPALKVVPSSSVFRYKGKGIVPQTAARELGVRAVMTGRVLQRGADLMISAELIDTRDNSVLWGQQYYRRLADILAVQEEIAKEVSEKLRLSLSNEEQKLLARRHTEKAEAYQSYLKGRFWWNKRNAAGFHKGIEYFNQARSQDPNYALAYVGLADCYMGLSSYGLLASKETFEPASSAVRRALEIDERLVEAHTSLAHITWLYRWDWPGAEREFMRAIVLNPNYATAHQWYSVYLSAMARHDEAIREAKLARVLEPLSISIIQSVARAFYNARLYEQAIATYMETLEIDPNNYRVNSVLDMAYEQRALYDQAVAVRLKAMAVMGAEPEKISSLRKAFAVSGWKGYWRKELDFTREAAKKRFVQPYFLARIYARLHDPDHALEWLQKAYSDHSEHLVGLKVDPVFDGLRSDPRFADLLRRIGLAR